MTAELASIEDLAAALERAGVARDAARREAERRHGLTRPIAHAPDPEQDERDEKRIVADVDKRMRSAGFVVVSFSQPRATKQSPGIPDRRYYHLALRLAVWWEAKTPRGTQRPDQVAFQEWCDTVGDPYVCGTDAVLFAWLVARGVALTT